VRARARACACINESRKNQSLLNMTLAIKNRKWETYFVIVNFVSILVVEV